MKGWRVSEVQRNQARELRRRMTPEERVLWQELRRDRLDGFHFRRQQVVHGFYADFYCHAARLVIEIDGPIHDDRQEYDGYRDAVLSNIGLRVLRITNEEIQRDLTGVVSRIRQTLD